MSDSEPNSQDCHSCGAALDPAANFCTQCGTAVGNTFCPSCGEPFERDDAFCAHCGHPRTASDTGQSSEASDTGQSSEASDTDQSSEASDTDPSSEATHGETREAFRRRIRDHLEAGWEIDDDNGDHVTLVDRGIGSIPIHILLLFITSGVGNMLYVWYHYVKLAERRYLSIGDGRQPHPPGTPTANRSASDVDSSPATSSYALSGLLSLIGILLIVTAVAGSSSLWVGLIGLGLGLGGLGFLPPVKRRLDRRHDLTEFGRLRTVDHRTIHPSEGYDAPCVICGKQGRSGLLRRRRDETVLAGVPVRTHGLDYNYYCEACAIQDQFGGPATETAVTDAAERVPATESE